MCLAIPGQILELIPGPSMLALVDVTGVRRKVDLGLLVDENPVPGDWVLIHVGFAMAKIDEREAELALQGLQMMGQAYTDEVEALRSSSIEAATT